MSTYPCGGFALADGRGVVVGASGLGETADLARQEPQGDPMASGQGGKKQK